MTRCIRLTVILILLTAWFTNASPTPLVYDDGGAESFWSDYYPNGIVVKFSPPTSRWRITTILVYGFTMDKGEKSFTVEIRDKDLNVIFRTSLSISRYFENATLSWAKIPLPNVIVKDDFYVCVYPMLEFNGTQLWIAVDNDTASNTCFLIDCYRQVVRSWGGGQVMIGVGGREAIESIEIIPSSIFIDEDALGLSFKIVAPSNDVEVRAILQAGSVVEDCKVELDEGLYKTRIEWSRFLRLKDPVKLLLVAEALNSTEMLVIGLNETLFSKHLGLKGENERLRAMVNSSSVEPRASRDRLEKEEDAIVLLKALLKECRKMVSEKTDENERLIKELSILRPLAILLAILTVSLILFLKQGIRLSRFTGGDRDA